MISLEAFLFVALIVVPNVMSFSLIKKTEVVDQDTQVEIKQKDKDTQALVKKREKSTQVIITKKEQEVQVNPYPEVKKEAVYTQTEIRTNEQYTQAGTYNSNPVVQQEDKSNQFDFHVLLPFFEKKEKNIRVKVLKKERGVQVTDEWYQKQKMQRLQASLQECFDRVDSPVSDLALKTQVREIDVPRLQKVDSFRDMLKGETVAYRDKISGKFFYVRSQGLYHQFNGHFYIVSLDEEGEEELMCGAKDLRKISKDSSKKKKRNPLLYND